MSYSSTTLSLHPEFAQVSEPYSTVCERLMPGRQDRYRRTIQHSAIHPGGKSPTHTCAVTISPAPKERVARYTAKLTGSWSIFDVSSVDERFGILRQMKVTQLTGTNRDWAGPIFSRLGSVAIPGARVRGTGGHPHFWSGRTGPGPPAIKVHIRTLRFELANGKIASYEGHDGKTFKDDCARIQIPMDRTRDQAQ